MISTEGTPRMAAATAGQPVTELREELNDMRTELAHTQFEISVAEQRVADAHDVHVAQRVRAERPRAHRAGRDLSEPPRPG